MIQDEMDMKGDGIYLRMMEETLRIEVRRLWEVERLTMRQIASKLRMGRKTVWPILRGETVKKPRKPPIIAP